MLRKRLFLLCALLLTPASASAAQSAARGPDTTAKTSIERTGSWSAATTSGATLIGTWTATLDPNGTVTGTWALVDAQGTKRADGAWSAAKSPSGWTGAWRAVISGREGQYLGTWTAALGRSDTRLADLFEKAIKAVVSGTWRVGGRSGAWSIRTFDSK